MAKQKSGELSERDRLFIHEYLVDLNPKEAALRAGYAKATAITHAYIWVARREGPNAKPLVFDAVQRALASRVQKADDTTQRILDELKAIAFVNTSDVVEWGQRELMIGFDDEGRKLPPDQLPDAVVVRTEKAPFVAPLDSRDLPPHVRAAVSEVSLTRDGGLRIKLHDKNAALDKLARMHAMYKDQMALTGPGGVPLPGTVVNITTAMTPQQAAEAYADMIAKQEKS